MVRHRVVLSGEPCQIGEHSRRELHEMMLELSRNPDLMRASGGWHPDELRFKHDGERWICEIEAEEEAAI